jgi:putative RNA 2'-phosphotransferase
MSLLAHRRGCIDSVWSRVAILQSIWQRFVMDCGHHWRPLFPVLQRFSCDAETRVNLGHICGERRIVAFAEQVGLAERSGLSVAHKCWRHCMGAESNAVSRHFRQSLECSLTRLHQGARSMTDKEIIRVSKFLSLILRHEPERVGLKLDSAGWVGVNELLEAVNRNGVSVTVDQLKHVVATNDKKRFALSEDSQRIGASQGHSIEADLQYERQTPPEFLYHGTPEHFLDSIRATGLNKGQRHHVHLSPDPQTAVKVGQRRGRPVVLTIRSGEMYRQGHVFYRSANGVWLVDRVPVDFIEIHP